MGTKLQCTINLLATSPNSSSFTLNSVDDWDYFGSKGLKEKLLQRSGLDKLQDSMDRMLELRNIEAIKKTMLMHEDIFKHQVRELHRLYSLQKMLMDELKNETNKTRFWSPMSDTQISGYNLHVQSLRDDPSSREQSGSCSGDNLRLPRYIDIERPCEEGISTRVISAIEEDPSGPRTCRPPTNIMRITKEGSDEETEVELTLSIGGSSSSSSKRKLKSDGGEQCSEPTNTLSSSSTATFDQERKRPHWLFQGLSLNRT